MIAHVTYELRLRVRFTPKWLEVSVGSNQQAPFHCQLSIIQSDNAKDGLVEFATNDTMQVVAAAER